MTEDQIQKQDAGKIFLQWKFFEFPIHQRGLIWYFVSGLFIVLFLGYAVLTGNFLFALIIILFVLLFYIMNRSVREITIQIGEDGVLLGSKLYQYSSMEKYWVIYNPPQVKSLYIQFKNFLSPRLVISLESQSPLKIREILSNYVVEDLDQEEEPPLDTLTRVLKL